MKNGVLVVSILCLHLKIVQECLTCNRVVIALPSLRLHSLLDVQKIQSVALPLAER